MASIRECIGKNGKTYHVQIRISGQKHISATFKDYETAYIWGKYKETILQEMRDFDPDPNHMYTVRDVLINKYGESGREYIETHTYFTPILDSYIFHLDKERLMELAKTLLKTEVLRGGSSKSNSGKKKLPEPMTILRKFAYLSSAINHMIKQGVSITNNTVEVIAYLRELSKRKKNDELTTKTV